MLMSVLNDLMIYLLPLFLAMGYFSVSLSNSRGGQTLKPGTPMKASVIFALSSFLLLLAGFYAAGLLDKYHDDGETWVSPAMLVLIAVRVIFNGWRKKSDVRVFDIEQVSVIFAMAIALGINNIFAGVALRFMNFAFSRVGLILALMVWLFSFSGLLYGNQFKAGFGRIVEMVAGIGLLVLAVAAFYAG